MIRALSWTRLVGLLLALAALVTVSAWFRLGPFEAPPAPAISRGTADAQPPPFRVNVNTAPWFELSVLPGVGEVRAQAIVRHRDRHGPFASPEDLLAVDGLGPVTIDRIRPWIVVTEPR